MHIKIVIKLWTLDRCFGFHKEKDGAYKLWRILKLALFSLNLLDISNKKMANHNKLHLEHHLHTYNIMLDANESTKKILDDEEALCLDGTLYGNVTRFLNHECHDANLLDILVQKESNAKHIYHVCGNVH
jgi:hypothetical protein